MIHSHRNIVVSRNSLINQNSLICTKKRKKEKKRDRKKKERIVNDHENTHENALVKVSALLIGNCP